MEDNDSNPGYANTWEFLEDGGIYHSVLTFRGGTGSTFAEGATNQLGITDNNNMYLRNSGANQVNALSMYYRWFGYVNGVTTVYRLVVVMDLVKQILLSLMDPSLQ